MKISSQALSLSLSLLALGQPLVAQGSPPQGGSNQPYTMEYYYKVQWGRQQEFLQLFLKQAVLIAKFLKLCFRFRVVNCLN